TRPCLARCSFRCSITRYGSAKNAALHTGIVSAKACRTYIGPSIAPCMTHINAPAPSKLPQKSKLTPTSLLSWMKSECRPQKERRELLIARSNPHTHTARTQRSASDRSVRAPVCQPGTLKASQRRLSRGQYTANTSPISHSPNTPNRQLKTQEYHLSRVTTPACLRCSKRKEALSPHNETTSTAVKLPQWEVCATAILSGGAVALRVAMTKKRSFARCDKLAASARSVAKNQVNTNNA